MDKIAAILLTFDRPHYLRHTVERLEQLEHKEDVDWILLQDGQYNPHSGRVAAEERDIKICHNILKKADLPNKEIIQSSHNRGIALQYARAMEFLNGDYDAIFTFEDDVLVSKHTIRLNRVMMRNYPQHVPTVYSRPDRTEVDNTYDNLDVLIRCKTAAFHTTAISSRIYEHIRDRYREYISMVSEVDYRLRNHDKIKEEFGSRLSSHDSVVNKILSDHGYGRVRPLVTRAIYIGQEGEHYSSDAFVNRHRYDSSTIDYEIDDKINNFRTVQSQNDLF